MYATAYSSSRELDRWGDMFVMPCGRGTYHCDMPALAPRGTVSRWSTGDDASMMDVSTIRVNNDMWLDRRRCNARGGKVERGASVPGTAAYRRDSL